MADEYWRSMICRFATGNKSNVNCENENETIENTGIRLSCCSTDRVCTNGFPGADVSEKATMLKEEAMKAAEKAEMVGKRGRHQVT